MTEKKELNFVEGNTIFIHDSFKSNISSCVLPYFDKLIENEKNEKEGKIIIDIASTGGNVDYLKAMLARVEKAKKEGIIIETKVLSYAYSCGSVLACSGTKGYRFVSEDAVHLCHLGSAGFYAFNDIQLERETERVKKYKKYAKIPNLMKIIKDNSLYVKGQKIIDWELADKFY